MKKFLPIVIVVAILLVAIPLLRQYRSVGLAAGKNAPSFTLLDLEGKAFNLDDFNGQVVMINFWSATCPPCREEMPAMQKVYDELKDDGFVILAINVNDMPVVAKKFIESNGYTFPVLKDDGVVAKTYEVQFIPKTLILDRDGVVRFVEVGQLSEEQIRNAVQAWL